MEIIFSFIVGYAIPFLGWEIWVYRKRIGSELRRWFDRALEKGI